MKLYGFCVGTEPGNDEEMEKLVDFISELDGIADMDFITPWSAIAWFREVEQMKTAQWMLEMNGGIEI